MNPRVLLGVLEDDKVDLIQAETCILYCKVKFDVAQKKKGTAGAESCSKHPKLIFVANLAMQTSVGRCHWILEVTSFFR